ncbi:hypothetical protein D9758_014340 [Tetrapyrgos nigripes]|uniref:SH3 domain-containing protein n=1 Tax=Tetrapyrgos nigripes TaxID=182062 RepID=A0A8H5FGS8_9AGAR|nr:hypothetical protein D9758_014340 [Tetrapyrgos nigripes]
MHVARDPINHQRIARRVVQDADTINRRDPALINLPVALPSLPLLDPLLDPILTPLIAGPAPAPTSTPAPEPTTTDSSSSGGNSGGNSSGNSSSGNGSGSSGSGSSESGSGSSGSSGGGSSEGGSGNTSGGSTGNAGSNGAGSSSGSSTDDTSPSSPAANSGSSSSGSSSSSSSSPSSASGTSGSSSSASASGAHSSTDSSIPIIVSASGSAGSHTGSTFASSPGGQESDGDAPGNAVNVGSDPNSVSASHDNAATIASSGHGASPSHGGGSPSSGSTGGTTSGPDGGSISTGGDAPTGGSSSHGLSTGAIAGIVVTAAVLSALLFVFCLRRRYITRRTQRRTKWADQAISSDTINWNQPGAMMGNGTMSARSSFATTYDISNDSINIGEVPAVPPMAEIRDTHSPGFMTHTQQVDIGPTSPPLISLNDELERRNSTGSKHSSSSSSDPYSQYLVIRQPPGAVTGGNGSLPSTPMSVRPFSPSEAFTFPKPPRTPGEEPSQWLIDTSIPSSALNPFLDTKTEFDETEIIRRPFVPTLDDEMRVSVGERVRIIQVYSDGWSLVERRAVDDRKGKGTSPEGTVRGLIPVDCFREAGQELPAFLAAKRVSGYDNAAAASHST